MEAEARPPIDLAQLATGADPAAETARLIMALDQSAPDPLYEAIVQDTLLAMTTISQLPAYASLPIQEQDGQAGGPTEHDARALLMLKAWDVMSALVAQREQA